MHQLMKLVRPGARGTGAPLALFIVAVLFGCGTANDTDAGENGVARAAALPQQPPYQVVEVESPAGLRGVVKLAGAPPPDSIVLNHWDLNACGEYTRVAPVRGIGDNVGDVVVWLADARRGVALPVERRYAVTHRHCEIAPMVSVAVVGGTLNLRNEDNAAHRTRFVRHELGTTIRTVSQVYGGSVVPVRDLLQRPGRYEIRCDQHPGTAGWLHVFDHPYHAVTRLDGVFSFPDVPPGTYRLMAWHPRLGTTEQSVTLRPFGEGSVEIRMSAGGNTAD